ncbi:MAG: RICIN domain-containing protein [Bryobacteraceae bacterium]|nr:RICIN domain-containing protein [Bryobacteraceae bacterium]
MHCQATVSVGRLILAAALVLGGSAPALCQGGFDGAATYEIANRNSNKVLDLDRNDRTTLIQFESRGTDNQRWQVRDAGGGFFYLINLMNGQALEATGPREVRGMPFRRAETQQWRFQEGPQSTAFIVNRNGAVLDVTQGSRDNGARLGLYSLNNSGAQQFQFRRVGSNAGGGWPSTGAVPPSAGAGVSANPIYEIVNRGSNKLVDLDRNDGATVIQYDATGADNQRWELRDAGNGWSYIVNRMNGHALDATGSRDHSALRATPLRRAESQQWRTEPGPDGSLVIVNRNGAVLDVSEGSRNNGARLQMFSRNNTPAQRFELRRVDAVRDRRSGRGR